MEDSSSEGLRSEEGDADTQASGGKDSYDPEAGEVHEPSMAEDVIYAGAPASDEPSVDLAAEDIGSQDALDAEEASHAAGPASDEPDGESLMDMLLAEVGSSAIGEDGENIRIPEFVQSPEERQRYVDLMIASFKEDTARRAVENLRW